MAKKAASKPSMPMKGKMPMAMGGKKANPFAKKKGK